MQSNKVSVLNNKRLLQIPDNDMPAANDAGTDIVKTYVIPEVIKSRLPEHKEKFRSIIQKFTECLGPKLDAIDAAFAMNDFEQVADLAHWLKGSATSVGFDEFAEPADDLEKYSKAGSRESLKCSIIAVRQLAERIVVAEKPGSAK